MVMVVVIVIVVMLAIPCDYTPRKTNLQSLLYILYLKIYPEKLEVLF